MTEAVVCTTPTADSNPCSPSYSKKLAAVSRAPMLAYGNLYLGIPLCGNV